MAGATAENYAGFNWVFALWEDVALTILTATEPLFVAFNATSIGLIAAVGYVWLGILAYRVGVDGLLKGLGGGVIIFLVLAYGMRPAEVQLPSGATVRLLEAQAIPLSFMMSIHRMYRWGFDSVLNDQTVAGTIIPSQKAIDNIVGRSADLFADSDLAQLIRDYNASCAPAPAELAGPQHASKIEALHAIGLLGGGGLGIPDSEITLIAQARTAMDGAWTFVFGGAEANGGWGAYLLGGGAARVGLEQVLDQRAMQSRREEGLRSIEQSGPFMGDRYALPTKAHWAAKFSGQSDATPSYLPISMIPGSKSSVVGDEPGLMFRPTSCVEAYRIAQLGAEQAYQALRESGEVIAGGQRVSAEVGAVSTALSWQRFMARSLEKTTGLSREGSQVAGGILATAQMFKDVTGWLDLQTLLPGYVLMAAWFFWIVLLFAPVFLLLAPLRGLQILSSWMALLLTPVIAVMGAQMVTVGISQTMAAVAIGQAGAASGWSGAGADYDGLRGLMSAIAAISLGVVTWITGSVLGVSLGGLAGSLSGAVATASDASRLMSSVAGGFMSITRFANMGTESFRRGRRPGGGGGSLPPSRRQPSSMDLSSTPSPRATSKGSGPSLNPPKPKG